MPHTNKPLPLPLLSEKDIARFWSHVDKRGPDDCWPWLRCVLACGYGQFWAKGRKLQAHRVALELTKGPPPDGATCTCHTCDVRYAASDVSYRKCCNPAHLFAGTGADNQHDAVMKGRHGGFVKSDKRRAAVSKMQKARTEMQRAQTHCINGHPLSGDNLRRKSNGARRCRTCGNASSREWMRRSRASHPE